MTGQTLPPFTLADWPAEQIADPYPVYRRYREADAVHRVDEGFVVFGYPEVARALASSRMGRRAPGSQPEGTAQPEAPAAPDETAGGARASGTGIMHPAAADTAVRALVENWLVFLDPPRHTVLRAVLNREFTPRVVARLRGRMATIVRQLLADRQTLDVVEDFAAPYPVLVISELLGLPAVDGPWLRGCSLRLQQASSSRAGRTPGGVGEADAAARELTGYFGEQLAWRRRSGGGDDLINLLLEAGGLTAAEIVGTCVHLLTAGHETTTNLISKAVLTLLGCPHLVSQLLASPALIPGAVEELARYDPPVQAVTRWAQHDEQLGRYEIPRGAKITLLLGSANRDPRHFDRPDVVDPRRPATGRQLAFGWGIHYCLGALLARAEAEVALAALVARLPAAELVESPVRYADDLVFHGPRRLMVRWRR